MRDRSRKSGRGTYCRACNARRTRAYAAANREKYRAGIEAAHHKQFAGQGLVNRHWIDGDTVYIEAFDGQGKRHVGMIDAADLPTLQAIDARWFVTSAGYLAAANFMAVPEVLLHRAITGVRTSNRLHTDHIDGDRLNNRRCNLRIVPASVNTVNRRGLGAGNTTGYRGIRQKDGRWYVDIRFAGKHICRAFGDDYYAACRFARDTYIALGVAPGNLPPLPVPVIGRAA